MADSNEEGLTSDFLGIQLSDSDEDTAAAAAAAEAEKTARTAQSEEAFRAVKRSYRAKVEDGELWRAIKLPLGPAVLSKPEAQALLHAVEELYFLRRYAEGAALARGILGGSGSGGEEEKEEEEEGGGGAPGLDGDVRKTLRYYEMRCAQRRREAEEDAKGVDST